MRPAVFPVIVAKTAEEMKASSLTGGRGDSRTSKVQQFLVGDTPPSVFHSEPLALVKKASQGFELFQSSIYKGLWIDLFNYLATSPLPELDTLLV